MFIYKKFFSDELPVKLALPSTIQDAKTRQQLSSLALLGQEFWRYPMANPRPPEFCNASPNNNMTDSFSSSDGKLILFYIHINNFNENISTFSLCIGKKKLVKNDEEIILDLVPLSQNSQQSNNALSTFKGSSVNAILPSVNESKPKRPQTLDLITSNIEKTGLVNDCKTPPQPPPRWAKPFQSSAAKQPFTPDLSELCKVNSVCLSYDNDGSKPNSKNRSLASSPIDGFNRDLSSPQSDKTNSKSFHMKKTQNSLLFFQQKDNNNKSEIVSPISDKTNFISKSLQNSKNEQEYIRAEKFERVFNKYTRDGKIKESAHYQESDILESPTSLYYYKSNVADKQSDYEDIWATDSFTTFKPNNTSATQQDQENDKSSESNDLKKTPDLLEKLGNFSKISFDDNKGVKPSHNENVTNESVSFANQVRDLDDEKQSSPFYAEPADALILRKRGRHSCNKSRHSDPFSFNNWSAHCNPYLSGGNILDKIDSQNDVNDYEGNWKAKSSLSFDNIMNLKKTEPDSRCSKVSQKNKVLAKGKPVGPPKIYNNGACEKPQQNWAVDSSWEFIGNEENEKEGERRFPSIEQQMDSDDGNNRHTVQEIIAQR